MVVGTAIPYANDLLPKQFNEKTAEIAPNKLPNIRFRGWAKGFFSIPKRSTAEAPNGAINNG